MNRKRLIVVSNRLPVTVEMNNDGVRLQPSCGGLVSALLPILRDNGGCWVGSAGGGENSRVEEALKQWSADLSYSFKAVFFTPAEQASFYQGYSNEIIWPLFHSLPSRCKFKSAYWAGYCSANEKFADAVQQVRRNADFIWVHDYHLMLLAQVLRVRGIASKLGYFHHIPFPSPEIFEKLPWRTDVLRALIQFDSVGFQTARDGRNFIACLRQFLPDARLCHTGHKFLIRTPHSSTVVGHYPISVDYGSIAAEAASSPVVHAVDANHQALSPTSIILGVDRLDYTKGIPERLMAFQSLLDSRPDLRGRVTMIQIVVPSREDIPEYKELKLQIEMLVSKINGNYGSAGWVPIHYLHRCVSRTELVAFYRSAHIAAVTPLKDGMNIVAKEFCASRVDNRGVLVLSEFAGAAEELKRGALTVNPHDVQEVASAFDQGLRMTESEQQQRMEIMREQIREHDVFEWARAFCAGASSVRAPSPEFADALPYPA